MERTHRFRALTLFATGFLSATGFASTVDAQVRLVKTQSLAAATQNRQVLPDRELPPLPEMPSGFADEVLTAGQNVQTYTLDSLLRLAAANNPTIRQASLHISAETAKALQAGLYPNPLLFYIGETINSGGSAGEFQGFEVQQRFVTAGKLQLSRLKYRQRAGVSQHLAVAQQLRVATDIQRHFYMTLAAMERLTLRIELVNSAEDAAVTARESYNQGQETIPGIRRSNVELQQRRLDVLQAENEYAEAFRQLSAVVGCPMPAGVVEGILRPQDTLEPFDVVLTRLITESPEVLAARVKLCVDQTTVRRESVEWVPDIVVQGGPGYNFEANDPVYNASVQLEIPLYDRNQGTILQAQRDLQRQQQEIRRVQLQLEHRLAMAYRTYATALQHATEYDRVIIPERQTAYRELLESYKSNRVDWPEVLDAQRDYFGARLTQINQFRDIQIQSALISGFMLQDGLMAAQGPAPEGHINAVPKPR